MAGDDRPVKSLTYQQFVDAPEAPAVRAFPAIVFNASSGPIRLLRATYGERAFPSLDAVLELDRNCREKDWPSPHTLIVSGLTYDYLAGLLNGTIEFPRRKENG